MSTTVPRVGITLSTAKGSFVGSLQDCVRWQTKHQGTFVTIKVGRFEFDLDHIEFDPEDEAETFRDVLDIIATEDEDLADRLCSSRFQVGPSPVGFVSCPADYDLGSITSETVKKDASIRILD